MLPIPILALTSILFALSRVPTPTAQQQQAMSLLDSNVVTGQSNALTDMWLLPYAIPEHEKAAIVAQDIARFDSHMTAYACRASSYRKPSRVSLTSVTRGCFTTPMTHPSRLGWVCSDDARDLLATDLPAAMLESLSPSPLLCFGNISGCILTGISTPAYDDYFHRIQDTSAQLRTVATLIDLRQTCRDRRACACLAEQATAWQRPIAVSDDGQFLQVTMYSKRWQPYWSVPLPAPLFDP